MSNIFENNEQPSTIHQAVGPDNILYSVLPVLPKGQWYEFRDLPDGRVAIVVATMV